MLSVGKLFYLSVQRIKREGDTKVNECVESKKLFT